MFEEQIKEYVDTKIIHNLRKYGEFEEERINNEFEAKKVN